MNSFFKLVFAVVTAILILIFVFGLVVIISLSESPDVKKHSYLIVDYGGELYEYAPAGGIQSKILNEDVETLQRILSNLEKAAVDEKIDGVIFRIYSEAGGYAMMEEIRQAIKTCQDSSKKVYAFAEIMSRNSMFLAAACDSIFMPPTGYFTFTGFASEKPFFKNTLNKLGIKAKLSKIKDYKTAAELLTEEKMTPQNREMTGWILNEIWQIYMQAVPNDRKLTEEAVVKIMEKGILTVEEAKTAGLIDRILYWEELENRLLQKDDKKLRTVSQSDYAQIDPEDLDLGGDKKIAVVHAQGLIAGHTSGTNPLLGLTMGSQSVINDLREAQEDEDVVAVVFRVNSGGGEHLTSDLISHQIEVLAKEKPVVVSMVDVAASGGYAIAYRGSKMMANSSSITGSIGSIMGMMNLKGLYDKIGMTKEYVTRGPMALLYSDYQDPTVAEWQRLEEVHWKGFNEWLADVAKRRGMTFEAAKKLAHGRVWSGRQAKENGLIDEVGGLSQAVALAKKLANIPEKDQVSLVHLPAEKSLPEMIFSNDIDQTAILNLILFHYFHEEIPNTVNMIQNSNWNIYDGKIN